MLQDYKCLEKSVRRSPYSLEDSRANRIALRENVSRLVMNVICGGEFTRIIREIRPKWIVAENVPGLLSSEHGRFFGRVLRDLAHMGYNAGWGVFSAFQAGMEHERKRICIVANSISNGRNGLDKSREKLLENNEIHIIKERKSVESPILFEYALRKLGSDDGELLRNDYGVPDALDRLKCLGNAVVPQQFYPVFQAIADIEIQGTE